MMRPVTFSIVCTAFAVLLMSVPLPANDGEALPIYPNTHYAGAARQPVNEKAVTQAVMHGDLARIFTTDSPQTVDRWYREKLPKSCTRNAITETAIRYTCATRVVSIMPDQGQTVILLGPKS
jgi:hypothetical protein